jgi:predicted HD phosphohydrolase
MMVLEVVQSVHLPPGSVGLMLRLGTTFVQQAINEKRLLRQKSVACKKLEEVAPPYRLHISGERYLNVVH